ncbi:QRFP-like peptide receptor isoform X1 [Haliotis asinina]|uniref:QRFP-like peptide receptor isoform X1 n=1 Tax=Haliotis asinina TaxID=109174 RepID=UPI003531945A
MSNYSFLAKSCVPGNEIKDDFDPSIFIHYNAPSPPPTFPTWEIAIKILFYVLAMLLDVVGNSIVILIIVLNRKMRTTTNVLILNLAVSDLMVAAFCMWVHVGYQIAPEWPFGDFVCKVNTFFQVLSVTSSVLTLTVISVERFMAIVFPFRAKWSSVVTGLVIVLTWCVSTMIASPHLWIRQQFKLQWKDRLEIWCEEVWPKIYKNADCETYQPGKMIYYIVEGVVMYFVPIAVMIGAYSVITIKLCLRRAPGTLIGSTASAQEKSKRKVVKMLVAVLVVFVLCWTPQQFMLLWDVFRPKGKIEAYLDDIKYAALYVAYLNSSLNPVLYGGFNENFRKGFIEAFRCLLIKKRNKVGPLTQSSRNPVGPGSGAENIPIEEHTLAGAPVRNVRSAHMFTIYEPLET